VWGRFRHFRRSRPFWGGLFSILGGIEILLLPLSPVADMVLLGVAGISGALIGVLLVITGLFVWFSPPNRSLAGVLTLVFSLASFVVSNLGGLVVGMVLGLVGGALTLAWTPDKRAGGRRRRWWRGRGGPPQSGVSATVVVLLALALCSGTGRAEASTPIPLPPPDPPGVGRGTDPLLLPLRPPSVGRGSAVLPPVLPVLAKLVPPALLAPVQPKVSPQPGMVVSGLTGELLMDTLVVTNFRYQGIVTFPVAGGGTQRALRILLDSTDIGNLRVSIPGRRSSVQVTQRPGAAHARTTRLELDCTRLRLNLFGVLPVEFNLDFPPPPLIVLPLLQATDVKIDYVLLSTPTLVIPGLRKRATGQVGQRAERDATGSSGGRPSSGQAQLLTRLASLLNLPSLLRPYGLNQVQAEQAIRTTAPAPVTEPRDRGRSSPDSTPLGDPRALSAPAPQLLGLLADDQSTSR
jgi:hypothetical protein